VVVMDRDYADPVRFPRLFAAGVTAVRRGRDGGARKRVSTRSRSPVPPVNYHHSRDDRSPPRSSEE